MNYQGYFLVALLRTSDVAKKYQHDTFGAVARDTNLLATLESADKNPALLMHLDRHQNCS
jgi:hypothetical protein